MTTTVSQELLHRLHSQLDAARRLNNPIPRTDRFKTSITEVGVNGFLRFGGKCYCVTELAVYTETDENFSRKNGAKTKELTLFCIETGETTYLEWTKDDRVEIYVTIRELSVQELRRQSRDAFRIADVHDIVDDEESLLFEGTSFHYDDDWASFYERGGEKKKERVNFFEFWCGSLRKSVTIEIWENPTGERDHEIFLSGELLVSDLEIISLGG